MEKEQMRYVTAKVWNQEKRQYDDVSGIFHCWGQDYEEFQSGPGNYTVAIIELKDGRVVKVIPNDVIFNCSAETQSGYSRLQWAEDLITQLPKEHEGRNSWLLNYGVGEEAQSRRKARNLNFDEETQSCELAG